MAWENRLVTAECELQFVCVCMCVSGGCRTLSKQKQLFGCRMKQANGEL